MTKVKLNLHMFEGDGGGAGAAPAPAGEAGNSAVIAPGVLADGTQVDARLADRMNRQNARRKARGEAPLYQMGNEGQQAEIPQAEVPAEPAAEPQAEVTDDPAAERAKRWNELKKGEMKDLYGKDVQEAIQKRLKNQHDAQAVLDTLVPAVNLLAKQRGIEIKDGDYSQFVKSVQEDDSLFEDAAAEAGMTVDSYRTMEQLKAENERYQAEKQRSQQETFLRNHYAKLTAQAEQMKSVFPDFNLEAELQNPSFLRMTSPEGGLSVEDAYYAIHHREIAPQAMAYGIQRAKEQMAQTIQANRARPTEGAMSAGQPGNFQYDPRKMTREEREALRRRAQRGERIEL